MSTAKTVHAFESDAIRVGVVHHDFVFPEDFDDGLIFLVSFCEEQNWVSPP
jgi:hypothetical protein